MFPVSARPNACSNSQGIVFAARFLTSFSAVLATQNKMAPVYAAGPSHCQRADQKAPQKIYPLGFNSRLTMFLQAAVEPDSILWGQTMGMELLEIGRDSDLARRGSSALELVQRFAKIIASAEAHREQQLQKALADISAAEDLSAALAERITQAEGRANEAEKWLRRLHAKLEEQLASRHK